MVAVGGACVGWCELCSLISNGIVDDGSARLLSCHASLLQAVALVGEFNNWDPQAEHWASRNNFGVWQLFLPDSADGASAIPHRCSHTAASAKPPKGSAVGVWWGERKGGCKLLVWG